MVGRVQGAQMKAMIFLDLSLSIADTSAIEYGPPQFLLHSHLTINISFVFKFSICYEFMTVI